MTLREYLNNTESWLLAYLLVYISQLPNERLTSYLYTDIFDLVL